jgi:hypothetical protein
VQSGFRCLIYGSEEVWLSSSVQHGAHHQRCARRRLAALSAWPKEVGEVSRREHPITFAAALLAHAALREGHSLRLITMLFTMLVVVYALC